MASGEKCYFVAELGESGEAITGIQRWVAMENGAICGSPALDSDNVSYLKAMAFSSAYPVVADLGGRRYFVERCFTPSTVYIFGAGHISQKLASLADMADFRVVVLDDREDFANRDRFPDADEVVVLDSFDRSFCSLEIDNDSYIVIVTRGHLHDATVLAQALGTKARYVGMMGSRKKREELFRKFLRDGFSEKNLERVRCPIGIDINAETQMEIAFSIVSQLILARTGGKKTEPSPIGQ